MERYVRLSEARDSTEAIRIAYRNLNAGKTSKDTISMNAVCARAGIPSSGYFSHVMNGQRLLNRKYGESLACALQLKGFEYDFFLAVLDFDHETDGARKSQLNVAIEKYRKLMAVNMFFSLPSSVKISAFVSDVFCSLSLFPDGADEDQIRKLFPAHQHNLVKEALTSLCEDGYLRMDASSKYFLARQGTFFNASKGKLTPSQYISSSFMEASHFAQVLDDDHITRCFLTSISVSLKKADYQKFLEDMKKRVMELVNCVDDESADQVIRVNVGVYPVIPAINAEDGLRI